MGRNKEKSSKIKIMKFDIQNIKLGNNKGYKLTP